MATRCGILAISIMLIAACGSQACKGTSDMATLKLEVIDYEPGRGATALWASPNGRYLAAEFIFVGDELPAVIKVIERTSGQVMAAARGSVVAGPDDSGEAAYVTAPDLAHPVLRSTARAELAIPLAPAAGDFAQWTGFRLGTTRDNVVVLRQEVDRIALEVVSLGRQEVLVSRTVPASDLTLLASAASPTRDVIYLSGKAPPGAGVEGHVVAVDGGTLQERWRVPWQQGHLFADEPALGVTGDGATVVAYAPSGLMAIDAERGDRVKMYSFHGHDPVQFQAVPGRSALVALRIFHAPGHSDEYAIEAIELPSGAVTRLRPDSGPANLPAITAVGTTVLVAPGTPPRRANDPTSWGPEVRGFVSP